MIEYELEDEDGTRFELNDATIVEPARSSFTLGSDVLSYENKIIENSALPGSIKLGKTRIESREVTMRFSRGLGETVAGAAAFRVAENALLEFLLRTVYLIDVTNSLKIPVTILNYSLNYDRGAYKLLSDNEIIIRFLDPFWKAITPDNVAQAIVIGVNSIALSNLGKLSTPPIITFTATVAVTQIQVYIDDTKEGIQIDDTLFGTVSYNDLIIDCENGQVLLEGVDRTQSILPTSGYFEIPIGASILKVVSSAAMVIDMDFNKRFYL